MSSGVKKSGYYDAPKGFVLYECPDCHTVYSQYRTLCMNERCRVLDNAGIVEELGIVFLGQRLNIEDL